MSGGCHNSLGLGILIGRAKGLANWPQMARSVGLDDSSQPSFVILEALLVKYSERLAAGWKLVPPESSDASR